jgi:Family of unknown function (DUF6335)
MAKRKAVRAPGRKGAAKGRSQARPRAAAKKAAASRKIGRKAARKVARKAKASSLTTRKATVKRAKPVARRSVVAKKAASAARKSAPAKARVQRKTPAPPPVSSASRSPRRATAKSVRPVARTAPGLNRERRTIADDDIVPSPPSSLDLDRSASSARSGRRELLEKYEEHTETGPALTGGDVDANWESAYSVGDEAPGGDSPTPDQDIVDDIGRAVGVEYQDNEELKGERKIAERDRHRWELDPASSDDWEDR